MSNEKKQTKQIANACYNEGKARHYYPFIDLRFLKNQDEYRARFLTSLNELRGQTIMCQKGLRLKK
jgi:hypothetical protein